MKAVLQQAAVRLNSVEGKRLRLALADQVFVSASNFLTTFLLARYLGVESFGVFSLCWIVVLFFTSLQQPLIIAPMMSIGAKETGTKATSFFAGVLRLQVLYLSVTVVSIALGAQIVGIVKPEWDVRSLSLPLCLTAGTYQLQDFTRRWLFSQGEFVRGFIGDGISYGGQLALLVTFHATGMTMGPALAMAAVYGSSVAAIVVFLPALRRLAQAREIGFLDTARRCWRSSGWLGASALLQWTSGNYFVVLGAAALGPASAGAIKACQNLFGVSHVAFQALENVVPASASARYERGGKSALLRYLGIVGIGLLAGTGLMAAAIAIWGKDVLGLLYGDSFSAYGGLMAWFAVLYVLLAAIFPIRVGLRTLEYTAPHFWGYAAGTLFALTGAGAIVTAFGLHGVVVGLVIVQVLILSISAAGFSWRLRGI
jgi:O-antigen/teichoic acid export membrane protein